MKKNYTCKTFSSEEEIEKALNLVSDDQIVTALSSVQEGDKGKLTKLIFSGEPAERIARLLDRTGAPIGDLIAALIGVAKNEMGEPHPKPSGSMACWLAPSGRQPREGQDEFYANIFNSLHHKMVGLCEASTGAGKTAAILAALFDAIKNTGKRGLIATPAMTLVRDFAIEHARLGPSAPRLRIYFGMGEFVSEVELLAFIQDWTGFDEQSDNIRKWLGNNAPSKETGIKQRYLKHSLRLIAPDIPLEEVLLQDTAAEEDGGMQSYRAQFNKENDHENAEEILLCSHAMLAVDLRSRLAVASRNEEVVEKKTAMNSAWKLVASNKETVKAEDHDTKKRVKNEPDLDILESSAKKEMRKSVESAKLAQNEWDQTAINVSTGAGRLPDYAYVVIDEAHLLEQSFSNSLSNYVALHQFKLQAEDLAAKGLLTKTALAEIERAYRTLCNAAQKQNMDTIHISRLNGDILSPLAAIEMAAKKGLEKITKKRQETLPAEYLRRLSIFKSSLACIGQAAHTVAGQISYLNLSPRLAYPRLFVGRQSVDQYLRFLWSMAEGAACVSATLYIPKNDSVSSWYMQSILAIPHDRKQDYPPVIPRWIRDTIKVTHMPDCSLVNGRIPLCPPSRSDKLSDDRKEQSDALWCQEVADKLVEIYNSAAGGCLVLMTSYSSINNVKAILMKHHVIAQNLIFAQQGEVATKSKPKAQPITIDEQRRKYLQMAFDGKKPIWLALGNAWTGINLSGGDPMKELFGEEIPANEDNVLTDLIIPRLPFGVNKSVTHAYRIAHKKTAPWERIDTLLRLRQGVGRLVRRHGVPKNRRIHILDGRLCKGILADMMKPVQKTLMLLP